MPPGSAVAAFDEVHPRAENGGQQDASEQGEGGEHVDQPERRDERAGGDPLRDPPRKTCVLPRFSKGWNAQGQAARPQGKPMAPGGRHPPAEGSLEHFTLPRCQLGDEDAERSSRGA